MTMMRFLSLFLLLFCSIAVFGAGKVDSDEPPFACDTSNPSTAAYEFCRTSLPIAERAEDLVSRLTLEEKISQLVNSAAAIPRLGIPSYEWRCESLHGVAPGYGISFNGTIRSATSFPQVILAAASFNPLLWYRIAQAIGIEARAFYNEGQASGMTLWAPNINIFRDPRWGRGQETPGEDPMMNAKYAVSYVRGLQGDSFDGGSGDLDRLRASACCKHFTAYDLENWNGTTRYVFNAIVSVQDLEDTYQPPFKSCVEEGRASGIMCSYNQLNGVPTCADFNLLSKTARESWGLYGYITSDCGAVDVMDQMQGYAKTPEDAVVDVLRAGTWLSLLRITEHSELRFYTAFFRDNKEKHGEIYGLDVVCGSYPLEHTESAIQNRKISESDINRALHNIFSIRMRLGLFNGNPRMLTYGEIGSNDVCSKEHQNLALEAAREGIVLLKNSAKLLPLLKTEPRSLAVIGPNADNPETLQGNYFGPPCKSISPFQALKNYVKDIHYYSGCDTVACSSCSIDGAVEVAKTADRVILIMGMDQTQEKENTDREDLILPGQQQNLIAHVAEAAKKPVILVLLCGGPVDVTFAKYNYKIGSILWAGYPGEAGGIALAEIIFGDHNPGGRLPITWYPQEFTRVPMTDMRMRSDPATGYPGRTYRFYNGRQVFKFGYGLSYSAYSYKFVSVTQNLLYLNQSGESQAIGKSNPIRYNTASLGTEFCEKLKFSATVAVKNHGEMSGKHPVLLFLERSEIEGGSPVKQLVGFESVHLDAGKRVEVAFVLSPCEHLSKTEEDGSKVLEGGSHFLVVGDEKYLVNMVSSKRNEWPSPVRAKEIRSIMFPISMKSKQRAKFPF